MKILDYLKLIRPQQWYKNLVIFLPIIFVGQAFVLKSLLSALMGFAALCLMSSVNYIINDAIDRKKDILHPEKRTRPLASGKITIFEGLLLATILFLGSIIISLNLTIEFTYSLVALFLCTMMYTFFFKKIAFADILMIGINFVIRAISGVFVLQLGLSAWDALQVSPWLVLCTFFLALFLAVGKRGSDIVLLGEEASKSREALAHYTKEGVHGLMILTTSLLVMSYSLYSFLSDKKGLLLTLPFALYVIFRYFSLVYSGSKTARNPELVIKDPKLLLGGLLWALSAFLLLYWKVLF